MAPQVQTRPAPTPLPVHSHSVDSYPLPHPHQAEQPPHWNQHRDALKLALGTILAPKRASASRTSSGTASPALSTGSHSFGGSSSGYASPALPPPHSSPASTKSTEQHVHFLHPHPHGHHHHSHPHTHPHPHHHPHTPSRLGIPALELPEADHSSSASTSSSSSQLPSPISRSTSTQSFTSDSPPERPIMSTSVSAPLPLVRVESSTPPIIDGNRTPPKAKFIQTLQSTKSSAWDALIHGSFS